ncbi:MAG TPA: 3-isopropylmalate dehydratase small subunit [Ktedonobacterales bacterium]|nr:3-isopropylmalate dehydratase small subunit [Ktedonobacterales bacterium]
MEPFVTLDAIVAPLDRENVNTDDITPVRYLKSIRRTGFAPALFANWRYLDNQFTPNPDFMLNQPRYQGAQILLARANFGAGSSREHAPWALLESGFRCIIAPSFADIFYNNCFNNGILPLTLDNSEIDTLFSEAQASEGYRLTVDLPSQTVTRPSGERFAFSLDAFKKESLLKGLDNIGWTLQHADAIARYEERSRQATPWVFIQR